MLISLRRVDFPSNVSTGQQSTRNLESQAHPGPAFRITQDLFTALHDRATQLYSARHNLLPPLTPSEPFLAESDQAHFDGVHARLNAEEERAIRQGSKAIARAWKRTRIQKANAGERRGVWTDASRAFEGSALVALGGSGSLSVSSSRVERG